MRSARDFAEVRSRLESVRDTLEDLILDELRSSVEAGERRSGERERRLSRARRAVERAIVALGPSEEGED